MNTASTDAIDPEVRKAGLALALWLEDNLFGFVCPDLIENEGPAVRLSTMRPQTVKGWTEFFPARALPETSCGISIRFRALAKDETVSPDRFGIKINGIRFAAEIYATFEERFVVLRITDSDHRLIAKPVSDETEPAVAPKEHATTTEIDASRALIELSGLPYLKDIK